MRTVGRWFVRTLAAQAAVMGAVLMLGAASPPVSGPLHAAPDRWLHLDDVSIRYREIGAGPVVVLLHGWGERLESLAATADALARTHRVIVPDLRGSGASTKSGDTAYYGARMGADVTALLDSLRVGRAHLVGFGMGAAIAAHLAGRAPERVRSLTLVSPVIWTDAEEAAREMAPLARGLEVGDGADRVVDLLAPERDPAERAAVAAAVTACNDAPSLAAQLRSLPVFTLDTLAAARTKVRAVVVVPVGSPVLPLARAFVRHWAGASSIEVGDRDHFSIRDAPEVVEAFHAIARGRHR